MAASSVGILFSTIAMVVEVACLLINFLEAPQAGLPVVQTNLGEGAAFWISAIDMVSLMALILAVAGEIVVLMLGLWLLYRAARTRPSPRRSARADLRFGVAGLGRVPGWNERPAATT